MGLDNKMSDCVFVDATNEDVQRPTLMETWSPRQLVGISCVCMISIVCALFSVFLYGGGVEHHLLSWGPQADFYILNLCIDTWPKYWGVVIMMVSTITLKMFAKQVGWSICKFAVFDQNRKEIYGFRRVELIIGTEILRTGENLVDVFFVVLLFAIYKFDIIIISVLVGMLISLAVVYYLLRKKTFYPHMNAAPQKRHIESH